MRSPSTRRDDRKGRPYAQRKTAPSENRAVISTYVSTNEPKDSLRTTDLAVQPLDKLEFGELFYSNGGSEVSIISTIFVEASTGLPGPLANPNRTAKSGLVSIAIQNNAMRQIIATKEIFIAFFIQSHSLVKLELVYQMLLHTIVKLKQFSTFSTISCIWFRPVQTSKICSTMRAPIGR